jgi:hypothetical protein
VSHCALLGLVLSVDQARRQTDHRLRCSGLGGSCRGMVEAKALCKLSGWDLPHVPRAS